MYSASVRVKVKVDQALDAFYGKDVSAITGATSSHPSTAKGIDTRTPAKVEPSISLSFLIPCYTYTAMSESTSAAPVKSLNEWHSPSSRTEVIHELIHGVGVSESACRCHMAS